MPVSFFNSSAVRRFGRCSLAVALACSSVTVDAACLPSSDRELQQYERKIGSDPAEVVRLVSAELAATTDSVRRALLYSTLAEASGAMERYSDASAAAQSGLALVSDKHSPLYVNLIHYWGINSVDEAGVKAVLQEAEALRKLLPPGSPAEACTLITLGQLHHQSSSVDQASIYLTHAYRMSVGPERRQQRVLAADTLSIVMSDMRDFSQALALNQDVIDWDIERGATFNLATSRFIRGAILREMGDHPAALAELSASRELSVRQKDPLGVAYADLLMCMSNIELREVKIARTLCEGVLQTFADADSIDPHKQALAGLAQIDLAEGNAASALTRLNRVLDADGRDLVPRRVAQMFEERARAHAALGQFQAAYADLTTHMTRFKASSDAERAREAATLRVRLETDREIERNTFLQRELQIRNDRLAAQAERLQWMIIAGFAGVALIGMLTYMLYANRKKKQLLVQLAQQDDLTSLPNRRRTFELANAAFAAARANGSPLTIAILDLDHFKHINDRFGHAIGDFVLQEFARIGRIAIREGDVLGRWGGEEFLVVLPDTTLDIALSVVERIREAALHIKGGPLAEELKASLSAGLATNESGPATLDEIIARADSALYDAKKGGRDLVCVAPESYSLASTSIRKALKDSGIALSTGTFERRTTPTHRS